MSIEDKAKQAKDDAVHDLILSEVRDLASEIQNVGTKVDDLKNKLYVGNGQKSLVAQIQCNTMVTKVVVWCVGVLYVALVGGIVGFIFKSNG